jgi:arsenite methyltransferase
MTAADQSVPEAIERALPLLVSPPAEPDVSRGYLDLLGGQTIEATGPIQSLWASGLGSALYDHTQTLSRRVLAGWQFPESALNLPQGGRALDIGCGPGTVTGKLGRAVGPSGLALGLDVSAPMLERAVRTETDRNVGFLRADARELPFPPETFDGVISLLTLQLIPEPLPVLANMTKVLVPDGQLTILVPTAAGTLMHRAFDLFGVKGGLTFFKPDEVAKTLHDNGMERVHTRQSGTFLQVTAHKAG